MDGAPENRCSEDYFLTLSRTIDLMARLVDSYRILIGTASQLNTIGLAEKKEIKEALRLANNITCILDDYIEAIDSCGRGYLSYFCFKMQILQSIAEAQVICQAKGCIKNIEQCLSEGNYCEHCNKVAAQLNNLHPSRGKDMKNKDGKIEGKKNDDKGNNKK
ncbi:hypothetical protein KQI30_06930 [Clostridium bornimense]|uniref:hypothetical protein n=1 Tax=Clostridium bornimense TaxID=1216932 RepID=UPI001C121C48|nr:hypothetical protein [Clostridium bornimense]MBU5316001.1 hypothetical protein [Clostridium bornimense]